MPISRRIRYFRRFFAPFGILSILSAGALAGVLIAAGLGLPVRAANPASEEPAGSPIQSHAPPGMEGIQVPPPAFEPGLFPCSACHADMPVDTTPRKLKDMHTEIVLKHGPGMWCLDCHSAKNRDKLHLVDGTLIDFSKLYLLCGQCHGDKLRDWKAGVHGKRTGYWNGQKQYLLCVNCHNPHSPHFKPIKPKPAPVPPRDIQLSQGRTP